MYLTMFVGFGIFAFTTSAKDKKVDVKSFLYEEPFCPRKDDSLELAPTNPYAITEDGQVFYEHCKHCQLGVYVTSKDSGESRCSFCNEPKP